MRVESAPLLGPQRTGTASSVTCPAPRRSGLPRRPGPRPPRRTAVATPRTGPAAERVVASPRLVLIIVVSLFVATPYQSRVVAEHAQGPVGLQHDSHDLFEPGVALLA